MTIPCYAERRDGGVADDELLMAIPPYGIQSDAAAGLAVSYADKSKP